MSRGFTLLEVLVVLVLLGLASALVAPSLLSPPRRPDDAVASLIDAARRAAVQRAGPVTLSFDAGGNWMLEAADAEPRSGTTDWPYEEPVRIRISALGACSLESPDDREPSMTIDAVRCRLQR